MWEEKMITGILDTYRCLLSGIKTMPGMKLEDAFNSSAVASLKAEQAWLIKQDREIVELKAKLDEAEKDNEMLWKLHFAALHEDTGMKLDHESLWSRERTRLAYKLTEKDLRK